VWISTKVKTPIIATAGHALVKIIAINIPPTVHNGKMIGGPIFDL